MSVLVVSAGCSVTEAGTPRPADTSGIGTTSSDDEGDGGPLAGIDPCSLLDEADLASLDFGAGDRRSDFACDWAVDPRVGVRLELLPEDSVDSAPNQGEPLEVGGHEARLVAAPEGEDGICGVLVVTSPSSYVAITGSAGLDTERACQLATEVAQRIDSRLP